MAESTLSLDRTGFMKSIGFVLGYGLDSTAWTADGRQKIEHCLDVGCRRAYSPPVLQGETMSHDWSFLRPVTTTIELNGEYAIGTITGVDGTITLASGTWPSWAADAELVVDDRPYPVASRTSDTIIVLEDTTADFDALTEYSLQQATIELPDLFGGFTGNLFFANSGGTTTWFAPVQRTGVENILHLRQQTRYTAHPQVFAVHPKEETGDSFQKMLMSVYPAADADYTLTGEMIMNPFRLTSSLPYALGGYQFTELLRESCMAAAESEIMGEPNGPHYQLFMQRLAASVAYDRKVSNPRNLGPIIGPVVWPNKQSQGWPWTNREIVRSYPSSPVVWTN